MRKYLLRNLVPMLVIAALAGCSDDPVTPPPGPPAPASGWQFDNVSGTFHGLWPTSASAGFVTGPFSATFGWGSGGLAEGDGPAANDLWGAGGVVYAVGPRGVFRSPGTGWTEMTLPVSATLNSVSGTAADDVFAVGFGATIVHFDGTQWETMTSPALLDLNAVFARGTGDVFAGGNAGTLLRYNGADWNTMSFPGSGAILSLWGSGSDLYAVELTGTIGDTALRIHRFDGMNWVEDPGASTPLRLWDVWGDGAGAVYAAGEDTDGAALLCRVGGSWTRVSLPFAGAPALRRVRGSGGTLVVAGDDGFLALGNGTSWTTLNHGVDVAGVTDLWGVTASEVWAAGISTMLRRDVSGWKAFDSIGPMGNVTCGWSTAPGMTWAGDEFAFGTPVIGVWDGAAWGFGAFFGHVIDMWGTAPDNVVSVGGQMAMHFDGQMWSTEALADTLRSVWGSDSTYIAVGRNGAIARYDSSSWKSMASGTSAHLNGVWGSTPTNVLAVGDGGVVLRWDGVQWSPVVLSVSTDLYAAWGGGEDDVYIVGEAGTILHFDGTSWAIMDSRVSADLRAVFGFGTNVRYAAGDGGVILRLLR